MPNIEKVEPNLEAAWDALRPFSSESPPAAIRDWFLDGTATVGLLRRFYLFRVASITMSSQLEDTRDFFSDRFRRVLSVAYRAGWTVATLAVGLNSGTKLFLGFLADAPRDGERDAFERTLKGLLPGMECWFEESLSADDLVRGKAHGGLVAGVPALPEEGQSHRFQLAAILRAMHGQEYSLLVVSRPVMRGALVDGLKALSGIRDQSHVQAKSTVQKGVGGSKSSHESESLTIGSSKSSTISTSKGFSFGPYSSSEQESTTIQESRSETISRGVSRERNWSSGLSQEEQNSLALELEQMAEHHSERLMKGLNVGAWESAITFGAKDEIGRDTLVGMLCGELSSPSQYGLPTDTITAPLDDDRPVLLPKSFSLDESFPPHMAMCLTSEELALVAALPAEAVPGYDIREMPVLSLDSTNGRKSVDGQGKALGAVCDHGHPLAGVEVQVGPEDLSKHLFVCGLTGSGKTTTMMEILAAAHAVADMPFLVIESAKREYRSLLGRPELRDRVRVFTPGDASVAPLKMNPFFIQPGVRVGEHVDFLKAIFNASFSLYGPMPHIVEQCLYNVYRRREWDFGRGTHPRLHLSDGQPDPSVYQWAESRHFFPTMLDLRNEIDHYVRNELGYRGELSDNIRTAIITRLESLSVGGKGQLLDSRSAYDIGQLLSQPTVLELEALTDDDDKAFFVGLLLTFISEYRRVHDPALAPFKERTDDHLKHILVIEEAHRLLKNVAQERTSEQMGNPRGKAVEFFSDVISEMRSFGQCVAVVEQIPSKLVPDVIKNTSMKIVHRLVSRDDQALLASALGLEESEALYLASMREGHALFAREGMQRPVELKVNRTARALRVSNNRVRNRMSSYGGQDDGEGLALRRAVGRKAGDLGIRLLCTMACGEAKAFPDYGEEAVCAARRILKQKREMLPDASLRQSLVAEITEKLALGVFQLAGANFEGVMALIDASLQGDQAAGPLLLQQLAAGWEAEDAEEGALHRVLELAVDRLLRNRAGRVNLDVASVVQSYFLPPWSKLGSKILPDVVQRLKRLGWQL